MVPGEVVGWQFVVSLDATHSIQAALTLYPQRHKPQPLRPDANSSIKQTQRKVDTHLLGWTK